MTTVESFISEGAMRLRNESISRNLLLYFALVRVRAMSYTRDLCIVPMELRRGL